MLQKNRNSGNASDPQHNKRKDTMLRQPITANIRVPGLKLPAASERTSTTQENLTAAPMIRQSHSLQNMCVLPCRCCSPQLPCFTNVAQCCSSTRETEAVTIAVWWGRRLLSQKRRCPWCCSQRKRSKLEAAASGGGIQSAALRWRLRWEIDAERVVAILGPETCYLKNRNWRPASHLALTTHFPSWSLSW